MHIGVMFHHYTWKRHFSPDCNEMWLIDLIATSLNVEQFGGDWSHGWRLLNIPIKWFAFTGEVVLNTV